MTTPNVETPHSDKDIALVKACSSFLWDLAHQLLQDGANPTNRYKKCTALLMVCKKYDARFHQQIIDLVDVMIEKGSDINETMENKTALELALTSSLHAGPNFNFVEHLMTHHPDCSIPTHDNNTLLHVLMRKRLKETDNEERFFKVFKKMIELGVDINAVNKNNTSVLGSAIISNYWEEALFLIESGARPFNKQEASQLFTEVCRAKTDECNSETKIDMLKYLLKCGADPSWGDKFSERTPLTQALQGNDYKTYCFLLEQKVSVPLKNEIYKHILPNLHTVDAQQLFQHLNHMGAPATTSEKNVLTQVFNLMFFGLKPEEQISAVTFLLDQNVDVTKGTPAPIEMALSVFESWAPKRPALSQIIKMFVQRGANINTPKIDELLLRADEETQMFVLKIRSDIERGVISSALPDCAIQKKNKKM